MSPGSEPPHRAAGPDQPVREALRQHGLDMRQVSQVLALIVAVFALLIVLVQENPTGSMYFLAAYTVAGCLTLVPLARRMDAEVFALLAMGHFSVAVVGALVLTGGLSSPYIGLLPVLPLASISAGRTYIAAAVMVTSFTALGAVWAVEQFAPAWVLIQQAGGPDKILGPLLALSLSCVATWLIALARNRDATMLSRTAEELRFMTENAADATIRWAEDGTVLAVAGAVEATLGSSPEDLVGRGAMRLTHPDDRSMAAKVFADVFNGTGPDVLVWRARRNDDRVVYLEARANLVSNPTTGGRELIASIRNVTERVIAENERDAQRRAAEANDRNLRFLTDNASDAILRYTLDGRVVAAGGDTRGVLGMAPEELIGRGVVHMVRPEQRREMQQAFEQMIADGKRNIFSVRIRKPDGTDAHVESRAQPAFNPSTGRMEIIASIRDITEHVVREQVIQEARKAAEAGDRAKAAFLANMSHELRTPLNAIIGFSDMMESQLFGPLGHGKYAEYAAAVRGAGLHLLDLISDMLDMAKIEAGRMDLDLSRFDLDELLNEVLMQFAPDAGRKQLAIQHHVAGQASEIEADRRAVKQMLLNLISNAVKFTPRGGQVHVEATRLEDGNIRLRVKDSGMGIPKSELDRLGRPFEQVRKNNEVAGEAGTGLGLALVNGLAKLHGGRLELRSAPGQGVTADIILPQEAA